MSKQSPLLKSKSWDDEKFVFQAPQQHRHHPTSQQKLKHNFDEEIVEDCEKGCETPPIPKGSVSPKLKCSEDRIDEEDDDEGYHTPTNQPIIVTRCPSPPRKKRVVAKNGDDPSPPLTGMRRTRLFMNEEFDLMFGKTKRI
ncbi:hypothetical protein SUGI_0604210 [Cryptomeria japonica]|nr:hypothetical protein SUGI_0604210 [Cryptomeria japonica]